MTSRIKVLIKFQGDAFRAFDIDTGEALLNYSELTFGEEDKGRDDILEAAKGINPLTKGPKVDAIMTGWVTIQ